MTNPDDFPHIIFEAPRLDAIVDTPLDEPDEPDKKKECPMQHTRIAVRIGRTQSLENYSNVRPEIEIEAVLAPGDDLEACKAQLRAEARAFVEEEVDSALEAEGIPAKFSAAPRFLVYETREVWLDAFRRQYRVAPPERLLIVTPEGAPLGEGEDAGHRWYGKLFRGERGMRLDHALRRAEAHRADYPDRGYRVIFCAGGNLAALPAWVLAPAEARHTAQELAALRAASWYEDHLGLGTRAGVVACYSDDADEGGWFVGLRAEGLEGLRATHVGADGQVRFVGDPAPAADAPAGTAP